MSLTLITNHVEQALQRRTHQFKDKPKLELFLRSILTGVQQLENVLYDLLIDRTVDTAEGVQLDVLGRIVGQDRLGLSDDDYRIFIKTRIAANRSNGLVEELINIAQLAISTFVTDLEAVTVRVSQQPPAAIEVSVEDVELDTTFAGYLVGFLSDGKAAGVRLLLRYLLSPDAATFSTALAAFLSAGVLASATTLPVGNTTGFPSAGSLIIDQGLGVEETVTYTAKTATQFLGVSPLTDPHDSGASVTLATGPGLGFDDEGAPGSGGLFANVVEST